MRDCLKSSRSAPLPQLEFVQNEEDKKNQNKKTTTTNTQTNKTKQKQKKPAKIATLRTLKIL